MPFDGNATALDEVVREIIAGKFGGTSLATWERYVHVGRIATGEFDGIVRTGVVVSAPGDRFKGDTKVTKLLTSLVDEYSAGGNYQDVANKIITRFTDITNGLKLDEKSLENEKTVSYQEYIVREIQWRLDQKDKMSPLQFKGFVEATGEFLAAHIFSDYLKFQGHKVNLILPEESNFFLKGNPINCETSASSVKSLSSHVDIDAINVQPGFYGVYKDRRGRVVPLDSWDGSKRFIVGTYRKGGSDISGAMLAEAISMALGRKRKGRLGTVYYDNYTDKPGVAVINPNLGGEDAIKYIKAMSYMDAMQLTDAGFAVLVPQAIDPVMRAGIPIRVRSTFTVDDRNSIVLDFDPKDKGTLIIDNPDYSQNPNPDIVGAAYKGDLTNLSYTGRDAKKIMRELMSILENQGVNVQQTDIVNSSSLLCDFRFEDGVFGPKDRPEILQGAMQQLRRRANYDTIDAKTLSTFTLVGPGINNPALKEQIFKTLNKGNIRADYINNPAGSNSLVLGFYEHPQSPTAIAQNATQRVNHALFNHSSQ